MLVRCLLGVCLIGLPAMITSQTSLVDFFKKVLDDRIAQAAHPPVTIEVFGEALCPDTTRFIRNQLMPMWNALQSTSLVNISYHPFGLASCNSDNRCQCQHGNTECTMNQLQSCVISALQVPQLYMSVVACIQGKRDITKAISECIVNASPRPDLDEGFMQQCAQSQLGRKLMAQHGQRQHKIAKELNWVPWVMVNGAREQKAEVSMHYVLCKFASVSQQPYCLNGDDNI